MYHNIHWEYSLGILQYIAIYKFPQYPALWHTWSPMISEDPHNDLRTDGTLTVRFEHPGDRGNVILPF